MKNDEASELEKTVKNYCDAVRRLIPTAEEAGRNLIDCYRILVGHPPFTKNGLDDLESTNPTSPPSQHQKL